LLQRRESQARKIAELEGKLDAAEQHVKILTEARDALAPVETPSVHCDACKDTGQVPIGHSGQDSDGNAMMFEPCDQCPPEVSVKNDFADTKCPFTGRPYFMHMDHDELGNVPTYGGPFDSYTIPQPDEDGHLRSERYDHDLGGWIEGGEPTGLLVVSEDELVDQPSPPPSDGKTIKNLCDRIDRICSIAHDKTLDLSERVAQVQMWAEGFAPIPDDQPQNNDAAIACKWIVDLFAWDMDGVTYPKPPYSWETVARVASDYAAGALKGNTSAVSDTARIDWLEKSDGRFFNIDKISATDKFNGHKLLRAAIDEAMRAAVEPTGDQS